MNNFYRLIDANINRAAEGIRTAEDIARFILDDYAAASELKQLRHRLRKSVSHIEEFLLSSRDADNDPGRSDRYIDNSKDGDFLKTFTKNISRAEEAVRSAEEALRATGEKTAALALQEIRYILYSIEKSILPANKKQRLVSYFLDNIYGLTASKYSRGRDNISVVTSLLKGGARIIQYREKLHTRRTMSEEAKKIRKLTREYGALFIVNDYIDLALMAEADGIHLGQDDWPITEARKIVGENMIIGVSTHSPKQAEQALEDGADYLGIGPVFSTNTKENVCDAVGTEYVKYAAENVRVPWVAIGGIKEHNMDKVCNNGASCIAMVTELTLADDIEKKTKSVVSRLKELRKKSPAPLYQREKTVLTVQR